MLVTENNLNKVTLLLDAGKKQEAVNEIKPIIFDFFTDVQNASGAWEYSGTQVGEKLQALLNRIRSECPAECQVSDLEVLRFQVGDRVYGYNIDESAILFALSPFLGEGNLIIDHLNDHYRIQSSTLSSEESLYGYKIWHGSDVSSGLQEHLVEGYVEFYQEVPKLAPLPRYEISVKDMSQITKENITMIDRACKAGILKTLLDGKTVHFNVDQYLHNPDFISQAPAKKDKTSGGPGFYTAKELRFVKRLTDTYPELAKNIKFYDKGVEVQPPWITHSAQWLQYKSKGHGVQETIAAIAYSSKNKNLREAALSVLASATTAAVSVLSDIAVSVDATKQL
ncbi:type III secretion protein GogB [Legionella lansingensis]|uniref:Uncharacterized protein n=1 Tax=Legionella lansingensis TaxID=45067 RepID=A0A0W0W0D5_9GAMM|nr:hypothetical protein [Legionella lansingensis]KTD25729.1 hypothetical protein Llan_0119 [Legionella lansingensis]SNV49281.1 type III secretion protein GogB [Legionella lansingensis]